MIYIKPSNGATVDMTVEDFNKLPEKQQKRWRRANEKEIEQHNARVKKQDIAKAQREERAKNIKANTEKKKADGDKGRKDAAKKRAAADKKKETAKPDAKGESDEAGK